MQLRRSVRSEVEQNISTKLIKPTYHPTIRTILLGSTVRVETSIRVDMLLETLIVNT